MSAKTLARSTCHGSTSTILTGATDRTILLVGRPNVGKSVLFGKLTGNYVSVSNYPGTTIDVSRGTIRDEHRSYELADTPGMFSLRPISEEERVSRDMVRDVADAIIVHVADAKNLETSLPLSLQLIDAGRSVVLAVNMIDEAKLLGLEIDVDALSSELGIPVVATAATTGEGVERLREAIGRAARGAGPSTTPRGVAYSEELEQAIASASPLARTDSGLATRAESVLLLKGDDTARDGHLAPTEVARLVADVEILIKGKVAYALAVEERRAAAEICAKATRGGQRRTSLGETIGKLTMKPATGLPILGLVLYLGLYQFVGVFGAGTVVDLLEVRVFEEFLNPLFVRVADWAIPWPVVRELFVGEYGLLTMGLRYAVAIILPVVAFFFLVFSMIEDSGYLPRLALLLDRVFKRIGLSGRAVIPMVLGLGCDTMATMVTRTLGTRRERIISTLLLALAVPCSAQLGVMIGLLSGTGPAFWIWLGVVLAVFLVVGRLAAAVLPGSPPVFYMEIPPMRLPRVDNVLSKTWTKVVWYMREIVPIFLLASALIWIGQITGIFDALIALLSYPLGLMGLPDEAGPVFLFGFFRRDYGAAGLYELATSGVLTTTQVTVAAVTLTLFIPCVAQFLVNIRERGLKVGLAIAGIVLVISFGVGIALNQLLRLFPVIT